MRVEATAPIRPTEVPERVEEAVTRFLPGAEVERAEGQVRAVGDDLGALRRRVWELRIIDAFRGRLLGGLANDRRSLEVLLDKQAAFQGRVAVPVTDRPSRLGTLHLRVMLEEGDPWPDAEALAWWLCPETKEGEVVGDVEL